MLLTLLITSRWVMKSLCFANGKNAITNQKMIMKTKKIRQQNCRSRLLDCKSKHGSECPSVC